MEAAILTVLSYLITGYLVAGVNYWIDNRRQALGDASEHHDFPCAPPGVVFVFWPIFLVLMVIYGTVIFLTCLPNTFLFKPFKYRVKK